MSKLYIYVGAGNLAAKTAGSDSTRVHVVASADVIDWMHSAMPDVKGDGTVTTTFVVLDDGLWLAGRHSICSAIHRYRLWVLFPLLPVLPPLWTHLRTRDDPNDRRRLAALCSSGVAVALMFLTVVILVAFLAPFMLLISDGNDPFGNPPGWDQF